MKLYAFDFDDSLVYTDNVIRTSTGADVSTLEYARETPKLGKDPFLNFLDVERTSLVRGPTFDKFARAAKEGSPIAIISARSNEPSDFNLLLQKMLTPCDDEKVEVKEEIHMYLCNSEDFERKFPGCPVSIGERKCAALEHFFRMHPTAYSMGFSDDDGANLEEVRKLFGRLGGEHPTVRFKIYKTETPLVSPLFHKMKRENKECSLDETRVVDSKGQEGIPDSRNAAKKPRRQVAS